MARVRSVAVVLSAVVLAGGLAGCSTVRGRGSEALDPGRTGWIVSSDEVTAMEQAGISQHTLTGLFDNPNTYYQLDSASDPLPYPRAVPTQYFTSLATIEDAFAGRDGQSIFPATRAVIYDNESFAQTPPAERLADPSNPDLQDPDVDVDVAAESAVQAGLLVHAHGLQYVNTPSQDLYHGLHADRFAQFLASGYVSKLLSARDARGDQAVDTIEFQLQSYEMSASEYTRLAQQAMAEVRPVGPSARVFFGLSSFPSAVVVPSEQVIQSFLGTQHLAAGYWMNTPAWPTGPDGHRTDQPDVVRSVMSAVAGALHD